MSSTMPTAFWQVAADRLLDAVAHDPSAPAFVRRPLLRWVTWQQRNQTTVAQALRTPQLAPAWAANLVVLDAQVADAHVAAQPYAQALKRARTWAQVAVPLPLAPHAADWVARAPTDEPIVYVAAALRLDAAGQVAGLRVALTGVSPRPVFVPQGLETFVGRPATPTTWQAIAEAIAAQTRPKDDVRGSAAYRRAMAAVLTRRALQGAAAAAQRPDVPPTAGGVP